MAQPIYIREDKPGPGPRSFVADYRKHMLHLHCIIFMRRALRNIILTLSILFCCTQSACAASEPIQIIYPGPEDSGDQRGNYYVRLLKLALSKTGEPYTIRPYTYIISGARVIQKLSDEQDFNITWAMDSPLWEDNLSTVRVPLDKGILGWRLLLINERDAQTFAHIHTLAQLRAYSAGQQRDWADVAILRANNLPVTGTSQYESMFQMLEAHRFDYFPRGIGEIWDEAARTKDIHLMVEPNIVLHYPVQTYFFVSKNNPRLHDLIEKGLRAAMKDGSFDALFNEYNGEAIKKARLNQRTVFELKMPK
jgi:ABC-type amino acid transport substrate-binding protein